MGRKLYSPTAEANLVAKILTAVHEFSAKNEQAQLKGMTHFRISNAVDASLDADSDLQAGAEASSPQIPTAAKAKGRFSFIRSKDSDKLSDRDVLIEGWVSSNLEDPDIPLGNEFVDR